MGRPSKPVKILSKKKKSLTDHALRFHNKNLSCNIFLAVQSPSRNWTYACFGPQMRLATVQDPIMDHLETLVAMATGEEEGAGSLNPRRCRNITAEIHEFVGSCVSKGIITVAQGEAMCATAMPSTGEQAPV